MNTFYEKNVLCIMTHNCFSVIAQVIIRATPFSFILLVSSLKTSQNHAAVNLKLVLNSIIVMHLTQGDYSEI